MKPAKVEPFKDKRGKNRVRIIADNNRNTYSSQGYHNISDMHDTMYLNMISIEAYLKSINYHPKDAIKYV